MKMDLRSKAIDKIYKRRDRIDMPDYQREEVWSKHKKQLLIDSILNGYHLPKLYFRKVEENSFECVDGQQRLTAIFEFFDNELTLLPETAKKFNATIYRDLPDSVSDEFDDFEIEIEEIEDSTDDELEELFRRLQLGTPLNTAENLNAINGNMRDFCHEISNSPFFSTKVQLRNTRYAHFEIATRWMFIETRGMATQVRFPQLQEFLRDTRSFSKQGDSAKNVMNTLKYLNIAFPIKCKYLRSRANVLSVCLLASKVVSNGLDKNSANLFGDFIISFFSELAKEVEKGQNSIDKELLRYQHAISAGSADGPSISIRNSILTKRLATYSVEFTSLLGIYPDAEDIANKELIQLSGLIKESVYLANRSYRGINGSDLFTMTTETVQSMDKLSIQAKDNSTFGDFIDALYFLFYEGSGSCNRLSSPPPEFVMDVKFLRTLLRHDVNHGAKKDIEAKHKHNAGVLKKYSGKLSIGEFSIEDLLSTQLKLLHSAHTFLISLLE